MQHHYGEPMSVLYQRLQNQSLFSFQNLYLYGGLFDVIAIAIAHLVLIIRTTSVISCAR